MKKTAGSELERKEILGHKYTRVLYTGSISTEKFDLYHDLSEAWVGHVCVPRLSKDGNKTFLVFSVESVPGLTLLIPA